MCLNCEESDYVRIRYLKICLVKSSAMGTACANKDTTQDNCSASMLFCSTDTITRVNNLIISVQIRLYLIGRVHTKQYDKRSVSDANNVTLARVCQIRINNSAYLGRAAHTHRAHTPCTHSTHRARMPRISSGTECVCRQRNGSVSRSYLVTTCERLLR